MQEAENGTFAQHRRHALTGKPALTFGQEIPGRIDPHRKERPMPNIIEGKLLAEGKRFALVASRFNDFITDRLVSGAMDALLRSGAQDSDIDIIKVPGAFEIPLAARKMVEKKRYDAVICLGAIIRGATPHFDYVCAEATKGIAMVSLESRIPVIFGIITADTIEQAIERAGTKAGNKGWSAALSAIEMANLMEAADQA
jgi:6,7-dimethyl-8-ribityllumazine synthase